MTRSAAVLAAIFLLSACGEPDAPELSANAAPAQSGDSACSAVDADPAAAPASESYDDAVAAANEAIDRAASAGHVWTTSERLLAAAEESEDGGDTAEATRLADEARVHADLACLQAEREKTAWRDNIIGQESP